MLSFPIRRGGDCGRIQKNFFTFINDRTRSLQGASLKEYYGVQNNQYWKTYVDSLKNYSSLLARSSEYQCQTIIVDGNKTGGDRDLYKYFMERCFDLSHQRSVIALLVPSAFRNTEGATGLRQRYLRNGQFHRFVEFVNRKRIFPIHGMFRFLYLVYERGAGSAHLTASFGFTDPDQLKAEVLKRTIRIEPGFLERTVPNTFCIPELLTNTDRTLFEKMHLLHAPLGSSARNWHISFVRELDMTNDSSHFVASEDKGRQRQLSPVYEGRMVAQFDCAAKAYRAGHGRTAEWIELPYGKKKISPHYYVRSSLLTERCREPRAGFCDITGHANERTVLAAILPGGVICGNKVPTCRFTPHG